MLEKKIVYVKEQIIFLCFSFETLAFAQMKKDKLSTFDSVLCLLQHFNLEDSCPKKNLHLLSLVKTNTAFGQSKILASTCIYMNTLLGT